jgi:hypothetical protein
MGYKRVGDGVKIKKVEISRRITACQPLPGQRIPGPASVYSLNER